MKKNKETCRLFIRVLKNLGCPCEKDGDIIIFKYQGGQFFASVFDEGKFVCVSSQWWNSCDLDDAEEMAMCKRAINFANVDTFTSSFYSIDEDDKTMGVCSIKRILLIPEITNIEEYFCSELDSFFEVRRSFALELERLRIEGMGSWKRRSGDDNGPVWQEEQSKFFTEMLKELGIEFKINDYGHICCMYHEREFQFLSLEGYDYVTILDMCWKEIDIQDENQLEMIKYAVNEANANIPVVSFYLMKDEECRTIRLCCKQNIFFSPQIPDIHSYFIEALECFIEAHHVVESIVEGDKA